MPTPQYAPPTIEEYLGIIVRQVAVLRTATDPDQQHSARLMARIAAEQLAVTIEFTTGGTHHAA